MNAIRARASAAMFEGTDLWWVSGGFEDDVNTYLNTSEIYNETTREFYPSITLPREMYAHSVVNINSTHSAVLCAEPLASNEINVFNRYYDISLV